MYTQFESVRLHSEPTALFMHCRPESILLEGRAASVVATVRVWSPKPPMRSTVRRAGDGVDGSQFAALDLGFPPGGGAHRLGELGPGEPSLLALPGQPEAALTGHQD